MDFLRQKDITALYCEWANKEYQDLSDAWKILEAKAQPLTAISSAFLAGLLAYGQLINCPINAIERCFLIIIGFLIFYSICEFIHAIRVQEIDSPFLGDELIEELEALKKINNPLLSFEDRYERSFTDCIIRTIGACENIRPLLKEKQRHFNRGLNALLFSGLFAISMFIFKLFGGKICDA